MNERRGFLSDLVSNWRCRSLWECGGGIIAEGRLLDLIRRLHVFGMCLMKMDIRQEAPRHAEVINAVTEYLGLGSYSAWDENEKIGFLVGSARCSSPPCPVLPRISMSVLLRPASSLS